MKKASYFFLLLCLIFAVSCKGEQKETETKEPTQMERVMATHDEVMPKMSTINKLITELETKVDTTTQGVEYGKAVNELKDANKQMMDWMGGFVARFNSDEITKGKALSEEKQLWLDKEEEKVIAVKDKMNGSIERAEALLGK